MTYVAAAQLDPSKLADGDTWTWTCALCSLVAQGGRGGLEAHMKTCHSEPRNP